GLYFYLEQLGARFYFPTDNWTIIPQKSDITLKVDRLVAPDFRARNFFGTGGFGKLAIDPKRAVQTSWETWKRRNRFGGEYSLGGHSGEAFNLEKKAILLEHPEYLAKVNGQHVPWSLTAKLNTANPDAVKLYVDWSLARYRRARQTSPDAPGSFAVSVDPSDGGGHCNSDECKKIGDGSASDQVFYIANQVAKAVRAEFPDGWVNLYGYNQHAMPPSFDLEPNVYVAVIPYAFQTTGLSPAEFIKAWGQKVQRMSIYDYWSIPDWNRDLPTFDFRNTAQQKLRFWHDNNIEGFLSESTYSAGALGPAWYVAARLMWDVNTDPQPILNEFYDKSFGPARQPMQRMLERWADGFKLTGQELALSYRDLDAALKAAQGNEAVLRRLADYGRYVQYLHLRYAWDVASPADKPEALRGLARYVWRIYPSEMIHAFRIFQLLARGNKELLDAYAYNNAAAPGWKDVTPVTDDEVFRAVTAGVQQFQPLDYTPRRFSGKLISLPGAQTVPGADALPEIRLLGATTMLVHAAPGQTMLPLKLNFPKSARIQLQDEAGRKLFEKTLQSSGADWSTVWQSLDIKLPAPGLYRLTTTVAKNDSLRLQKPRGASLLLQSFRTSKPSRSPRLYFYVPKGLKKLALYQPHSLPAIMEIRFFDPQGRPVKPTTHDDRRMYLVDIPEGQDGKVWSLDNVVAPNQTVEFLNAPQVLSLDPTSLRVPADALP
ncbi:MAG TPA: DUF4838 domain-containing protein, partial [Abditibacteriaceae bacterium]|nr:DUF4838 domain-containing protein [Abditibacteriaceae bacterium]